MSFEHVEDLFLSKKVCKLLLKTSNPAKCVYRPKLSKIWSSDSFIALILDRNSTKASILEEGLHCKGTKYALGAHSHQNNYFSEILAINEP